MIKFHIFFTSEGVIMVSKLHNFFFSDGPENFWKLFRLSGVRNDVKKSSWLCDIVSLWLSNTTKLSSFLYLNIHLKIVFFYGFISYF